MARSTTGSHQARIMATTDHPLFFLRGSGAHTYLTPRLITKHQHMSIKLTLLGLPLLALLAFARVTPGTAEYTDLNKNGRMDPYEDATRPTEERVTDLLGQMNLEEKAGMLFINGTGVSPNGDPNSKKGITGPAAMMPSALENLTGRQMNHFNIWSVPADPAIFAAWYNRIQTLARETRLGIPVTIASDPAITSARTSFPWRPPASPNFARRWASPPSTIRSLCAGLPT